MGTPAAIETGFAARLVEISGLQAVSSQPTKIIPPAAWPALSEDGGLVTFAGDLADLSYDVYLVVPSQKSLPAAHQLLLPYLARSGAQSVYAAIFGDQTLGGAADGIRNWTLRQIGRIQVPGSDVEHYGAVWRAEVMA